MVAAAAEASLARGIGGDETDNSGAEAGAAYVFRRDGASWSRQAYLKASNSSALMIFGFAVAISGDASVVAAGALLEPGSSSGVNGDEGAGSQTLDQAGAVYLY